MKCPNCGNETNGKFCENCGTPLAQNNTQESVNNANGFDSFNQNPTQEQQSAYDYNAQNQPYGQPYNSNQQYNPNGFEQNQSQNTTSYGQQFTNQNGDYNGSQQFTNMPNGQKNNSSKTAIIITSIVGGIIVLLIVIFAVVACNVLPKVIDYADKHIDKAIDSASSQISKYLQDETTVPYDGDIYDEDDDSLVDEKSHLLYQESTEYDGWKITGLDYDYYYTYADGSAEKVTINIPEKIDGKDVVEISDLMIYIPDTKVKIVIPKTIKVIDEYALSFNDDIYEIEIADGVEVIEDNAFIAIPNLKSITIPNSVKEMDDCGLGIDVDDNSNDVLMENFKIYCKKGSAAETYAKGNNIKYETVK